MPVIMNDVVSLSNAILSNNFDLIIANPPGGGDGRALQIRSANGVLPGVSHPIVPVTLHRFDVMFAGHRVFNHTFGVSFVDSTDKGVVNTLMAWKNAMNEPGTGLPHYKWDYARTAVVYLYDDGMQVYESRTFQGVWPSVLDDQALDGASDAPSMVNVQFCYDLNPANDNCLGTRSLVG